MKKTFKIIGVSIIILIFTVFLFWQHIHSSLALFSANLQCSAGEINRCDLALLPISLASQIIPDEFIKYDFTGGQIALPFANPKIEHHDDGINYRVDNDENNRLVSIFTTGPLILDYGYEMAILSRYAFNQAADPITNLKKYYSIQRSILQITPEQVSHWASPTQKYQDAYYLLIKAMATTNEGKIYEFSTNTTQGFIQYQSDISHADIYNTQLLDQSISLLFIGLTQEEIFSIINSIKFN